jgi:hypothetical protein
VRRNKYKLFLRKIKRPVDTFRGKHLYCLHPAVIYEEFLNRRTGYVVKQPLNIVIYCMAVQLLS